MSLDRLGALLSNLALLIELRFPIGRCVHCGQARQVALTTVAWE
jgi:hypothetical protein